MNVVPFSSKARLLIEKASEDRAALDFDLPNAIFGFHTQQAVEKLLKALIASNLKEFPYIHDLREFRTLCTDIGEVFPALLWNPLDLQDYAVLLRYETADPLPPENRTKMREAVDSLQKFVVERAQALGYGE